ncbi:MAG: tyrosine--tRNA ligase [Oligoflexales bacterium]
MSKITVAPKEQLEQLKLGAEEIISEEELLKKLEKSYQNQKPLIIKLGADPSRPDIHIGHAVVLNKLKLLQDFGHEVKFIIGDFTALIGDPTGKSKTRPQLTKEEVDINAKTYKDQVFKILDPDKTDVVYNSNWLNKFSPMDFIRLMSSRTVQQLIARDDFSKRYQEQVPIFLHELVYPVMQAYDSYELNADIELGGTDQKFNLLLGREFQRQQGQEPQCIILSPLLEGLDGVQKMSKSLGNYIGLTDMPNDMFGKTMSISDTHMLRFYELLSRKGGPHLMQLKNGLTAQSIHPMDAKKDLAEEIVSHYWGEEKATEARAHFQQVFSKKAIPDDIPSHKVSLANGESVNVLNLVVELEFCKSKSEARRILKQNGMKLNNVVIKEESIKLEPAKDYIFRQGKLKMVKLLVE